jgi:hypothetical protein
MLDDDSRLVVLKKNFILSLYDILYNVFTIAWWRSLWGHPEGKVIRTPCHLLVIAMSKYHSARIDN